jgi:aminoglycoside phosphotransferase
VAGRTPTAVGLGCTAATVHRLDGGLYLKTLARIEHDPVFGNLLGERRRLEALRTRVPVPRVVAFESSESHDFLLMTEVAGSVACSETAENDVRLRVGELARACRKFHRASANDFPFVEGVEALKRAAEARVRLGLVDASDFDLERAGRTPEELLAELSSMDVSDDDAVLTHGDMCLPNVILSSHRLSGFVDVGRAAVSDRWRDLALCLRSIESNWGAQWRDEFLREYGAVVDEPKLQFYTLLDEFF